MDFSKLLSDLEIEGNLRKFPESLPTGFVDFASNDYLGLGADKNIREEFISQNQNFIFTSSASRLLASCQEPYKRLEKMLEKEYGRSVLFFNSGYHANSGIIPALAKDSNCLIITDKLVHASIIDGVILSRAEFRRFTHNDVSSLRKIIERNYDNFDNILVITEGVFSMDGDQAPLNDLLSVKKDFNKVILYLDEAHSFGVKGPKGLGLAQNSFSPEDWDIIVVPLGKAAASMGAFAVCSENMKDFLINRCRSLIFSTALPPVQLEWTNFILKKLFEMDEERKQLDYLSSCLSKAIKNNFPGQNNCKSHIQPLIVGSPGKALLVSEFLYNKQINALAIRRPTVPSGTDRIRFSLSACMNENDINNLENSFREINATQILNK